MTIINKATDLHDLLSALRQFEDEGIDRKKADNKWPDSAFQTPHEDNPFETEFELAKIGIDICQLPTFGGEPPADTQGIWSWSKTEILWGEGPFRDWTIEPRITS